MHIKPASHHISDEEATSESDNDERHQRNQMPYSVHLLAAGKRNNHQDKHRYPMGDKRKDVQNQKPVSC